MQENSEKLEKIIKADGSPLDNGLSTQSSAVDQSKLEETPVKSSPDETQGSPNKSSDAEITSTPSFAKQNLLQHADHKEVVSLLKSILTEVNRLQQSMLGVKDDVDAGYRKITTCENYLDDLIEKQYYEQKERQEI